MLTLLGLSKHKPILPTARIFLLCSWQIFYIRRTVDWFATFGYFTCFVFSKELRLRQTKNLLLVLGQVPIRENIDDTSRRHFLLDLFWVLYKKHAFPLLNHQTITFDGLLLFHETPWLHICLKWYFAKSNIFYLPYVCFWRLWL